MCNSCKLNFANNFQIHKQSSLPVGGGVVASPSVFEYASSLEDSTSTHLHAHHLSPHSCLTPGAFRNWRGEYSFLPTFQIHCRVKVGDARKRTASLCCWRACVRNLFVCCWHFSFNRLFFYAIRQSYFNALLLLFNSAREEAFMRRTHSRDKKLNKMISWRVLHSRQWRNWNQCKYWLLSTFFAEYFFF